MARKTRRRVKRVRRVRGTRRIKRSRRYYTGGLDFGEIKTHAQSVLKTTQDKAREFSNTAREFSNTASALRDRAFGLGSSEGTAVP